MWCSGLITPKLKNLREVRKLHWASLFVACKVQMVQQKGIEKAQRPLGMISIAYVGNKWSEIRKIGIRAGIQLRQRVL